MPDTFSYAPSFSSAKSSAPRVLTAAFGDGYEQRALDGLNPDLKTWDLTFANRSTADADAIEAFFEANTSLAFSWTPPGGSAALWVCSTWRRTSADYGIETVTATFRQVLG